MEAIDEPIVPGIAADQFGNSGSSALAPAVGAETGGLPRAAAPRGVFASTDLAAYHREAERSFCIVAA